MQRTIFAAALAAVCNATKVVYRVGDGITASDYAVNPEDWRMTFFWPWKSRNAADNYNCSATMISENVALTAAHCISKKWIKKGSKLSRKWQKKLKVKLPGEYRTRRIVEIRVDSCWNFGREGPNSNDLALLFLNSSIQNAV